MALLEVALFSWAASMLFFLRQAQKKGAYAGEWRLMITKSTRFSKLRML